jgi:hypothetical protein
MDKSSGGKNISCCDPLATPDAITEAINTKEL